LARAYTIIVEDTAMDRSERNDGIVKFLELANPALLQSMRQTYSAVDLSGKRMLGETNDKPSTDDALRQVQRADMCLQYLAELQPAAQRVLAGMARNEKLVRHLRTSATLVTLISNGLALFFEVSGSQWSVYALAGATLAGIAQTIGEYMSYGVPSGMVTARTVNTLIDHMGESGRLQRDLAVARTVIDGKPGERLAQLCDRADRLGSEMAKILMSTGERTPTEITPNA
jgi:hypothetical protein